MILKVTAALCCLIAASMAAIAPGQNAYLPPKEPGYKYDRPSVAFPPQPPRPPVQPPRPLPPRPSYPAPAPRPLPTPTRPLPPPPPQRPYNPPAPAYRPRPPAATVPAPYQPQRPAAPAYIPPRPIPSRPAPGPAYVPPQRPSYNPPSPPPYRPSPSIPQPTQPAGYLPPRQPVGPPRPQPPRPTPGVNLVGSPSSPDQKFVGENDHLLLPHKPAAPFDFKYSVQEPAFGNDYSHNAVNDGDRTNGEYRVLLPDGRTQVVKYVADWATGFHAKISYEGNPTYQGSPSGPKPVNYPAPSGPSGPYPSSRPNVPFPAPNKPSFPAPTNQINQQYTPAGGYKY